MDLFSEENEVKQKFVAWDKVGKMVSGYFVDKRVVPNKLKAGTDQTLYTIMQKDGTTVIVAGRYGTPVQTFPGIEQVPLGSMVGFKYEGDREAVKKGFNATKIIRTYVKRGKDGQPVLYPEMLAKFRGETMEENTPEHF
jgi:hypothetical protein